MTADRPPEGSPAAIPGGPSAAPSGPDAATSGPSAAPKAAPTGGTGAGQSAAAAGPGAALAVPGAALGDDGIFPAGATRPPPGGAPDWGKSTGTGEEEVFLEGPHKRRFELLRALRIFGEVIRGFRGLHFLGP